MHQIARGIFYEDSFLGVTLGGLVFPHGVILVDAPLRADDARTWRAALGSQRGGNNRLLVILDAHPDRTLGVRALDCTTVAHQKTAQIFRNRPSIFKGQTVETGAVWELYSDAIGMRWASPDITFTTELSLHWGGPEILLNAHPGPTPGSTWLTIPSEKIIFVGDTLVTDQPPFLAYADLAAWKESLTLLEESFGDYTIIAGRGGLASIESIQRLQRLLNTVERGIERLAAQNAPPEATGEMISPLLAEYKFTPDWGERYTQRLRYGLLHYYARRYRPSSALDPSRLEDTEQ